MVAEAIIKPDNHVRKDVLFSTVKLYVRVDAISMSKDVIQRHKHTVIKISPYEKKGQKSQCPQ